MQKDDILYQLDISWQLFMYHMKDLSDEEALWCKNPNGLQIRRFGEAWKADWPETEDYSIGISSIAWTMWHITFWWRSTIDYSFGKGTLKRENILWPGSVELALKEISILHDEWIRLISEMSDEQLQSTKYTKWPMSDTNFYKVVLWLNVELMKNAAEIGCGRFIYATSDIKR